jgi:ribosomal-protein-alanine N-acetyltransferase
MIIRTARATDLPSIMSIEQLAFPDAERWTEHAWKQELDVSRRNWAVFVVESEPRIGEWDDSPFASQESAAATFSDHQREVDAVASFRSVGDTADIFRLMTAKGARRLGLATALVQHGLTWADALGVSRMLLEARSDNIPAQALYAKLGFVHVHERKDYYGTGVDAIVMETPLSCATAEAFHEGQTGVTQVE